MLVADQVNGPDLVGYLLNYGILGVLTLLWLTGMVVNATLYKAAVARAEAAEQREREMQTALRAEVVPALVRFTDTATRILDRDAGRQA